MFYSFCLKIFIYKVQKNIMEI